MVRARAAAGADLMIRKNPGHRWSWYEQLCPGVFVAYVLVQFSRRG
jgi:hypothetical protein